jgi:hypothetical protein
LGDRIKHFRAGLLLAISSAVILWPISYWFPLSDYLVAIGDEDYADFKQTLQLIIGIYTVFFILNLVNAGLSATKLSYKIKIWLSLIPAFVLLVVPVLLVIPIATRYPEQSFLEVFQALYRLLRFTSPELIGWVLFLTVLAVVLNVRAAITLKNATNPESVPKHLRNRYLIYAGVVALVLVIVAVVGMTNSSARAADKKACLDFAALPLPEYNDQVDAYISSVRSIADKTGSRDLKSFFEDFSDLSTDYLSLTITEPDNSAKLAQYGEAITEIKTVIDQTCSQLSVK